ncbi:MAG: hypothetical protein KGD74_06860 [Candidatus Lokiarchaeota archaeon]|nr:hypothetical protein [Candidatus Lokiarchaeota archaeon]
MPKINNINDLSPNINRLNDRYILLILSVIILLIGLWIPRIRPYFPSRGERFFELAILGDDMRGENYYPEDDPHINIGEQIKWNIYTHNHMERIEYVTVKIKLLNSTMVPPDSATCTPSPATVIYEISNGLVNNETIIFPLSWSINIIDDELGFTTIKSIQINKENINVDIMDKNNSFRFIFELWILDSEGGDDFGWNSAEGKRCVWTQIWFNVEN